MCLYSIANSNNEEHKCVFVQLSQIIENKHERFLFRKVSIKTLF